MYAIVKKRMLISGWLFQRSPAQNIPDLVVHNDRTKRWRGNRETVRVPKSPTGTAQGQPGASALLITHNVEGAEIFALPTL